MSKKKQTPKPEALPEWRATIITDASFCAETHAGGWAAWITINDPDGTVHRYKKFAPFRKPPASSVEAELWALLNGIGIAIRHMPNPSKLLAQCDCLAALEQLEHRPGFQHVECRHVRGHTKKNDSRSWVNRWCDTHARKAMRQMRESLSPKAGTRPPRNKRS